MFTEYGEVQKFVGSSPEPNKRVPLSGSAQPLTDDAEMKMLLRRATDTLAELCKLLEDYGPRWYTQPQQERAESTLRLFGKGL